MRTSMPKLRNFMIALTVTALGCALPITTYAASKPATPSAVAAPLPQFTPRPKLKTHLDFETWDFILSETVLYMGPSTRLHASRDDAQVGTRLIRNHTSPFKLEGNKVLYGLMEDDVKAVIKNYANELIQLGNRLDIPALPKNEQLAYWINLHNAVLVSQISENYPGPSRHPSKIKPIDGSDAKLHEAKLILIDDTVLSLRDIREKIVFPHWQNADVPFAFHLGHLGSPSLSTTAYDANKLKQQLEVNADEFVNSLRGYKDGSLNHYFWDISPWYFPHHKTRLDAYFQKRMRPEVYAEFKSKGIKRKNRKDLIVADMTGGFDGDNGIERFYGNFQTSRFGSQLGSTIDQFLADRRQKQQQLQNTEWFRQGFVSIVDEDTEEQVSPEIE